MIILVRLLIVPLPIAVNFGVAWAISHLTGLDFKSSLEICLAICFVISLMYQFDRWLDGTRSRGEVLVDIGFIKDRDGFIFGCFLFLLFDLILNFGDWSFARTFQMNGHFYLISTAFLFWFVANGSLKITQNGIWVYTGLIRWCDIDSYYWEGDCKLIIKTKNNWFGNLSINHLLLNNTDQKAKVDCILQQKFSVPNSELESI